MDKKLMVEIEQRIGDMLMDALKNPTKDDHGITGYFIGLNLATEIRNALGKAGVK